MIISIIMRLLLSRQHLYGLITEYAKSANPQWSQLPFLWINRLLHLLRWVAAADWMTNACFLSLSKSFPILLPLGERVPISAIQVPYATRSMPPQDIQVNPNLWIINGQPNSNSNPRFRKERSKLHIPATVWPSTMIWHPKMESMLSRSRPLFGHVTLTPNHCCAVLLRIGASFSVMRYDGCGNYVCDTWASPSLMACLQVDVEEGQWLYP